MTRILLTGFEPWADWSHNPSAEVAQALDGETIGGCEIASVVVPVVHGEDIAAVASPIAEYQPRAVVSLGLHSSAAAIHVERVAVNLKVIDDVDHPVVDGGPDAYLATLPTREMVAAMCEAGIPARLTYSAGTFLCNHMMYSVLHHLAVNGMDALAGFIHLPPTPDLVAIQKGTQASMALTDIQRAVEIGLDVVAKKVNDLHA